MRDKLRLFRKSLGLVWQSAPGWALVNIAVSAARSVTPFVLLLLIRNLIDGIGRGIGSPETVSPSVLAWIIAPVVMIYLLDEVLSDFGGFVRKQQSMKLEVRMYGLLHSKAIRLDLINFEYPGYFDILTRAAREAPWRPNSILNNLIMMMRGLLSLVLMTWLLFSLHWSMALLLVAVNIPGIWLRLHYAGVLYDFRKTSTTEARKTQYFNWLLTGERPSRELRLFGLGRYFKALFGASFEKMQQEESDIARKRMLIELATDIVKAGAILLLLIFTIKKTFDSTLSLGEMTMYLLAFRQGMLFIKELMGSLAGLYEDSLFTGDIFEFLGLKENIRAEEPVAPVPSSVDSLVAENLTFTYPGNPSPAISGTGFVIKKGEIVAVVGPNGAGKSTLVRLLTRLYDPSSGSLKINGTDIRNIDPEEYRKLFSVVFQDFMLYNLSAGENIRLGDTASADHDGKIRDAARITGIDDFISRLPSGYDTNIGTLYDDSRELSWGEWQKIALARAVFRDAPVLVLDEPSSALDADSEFEIFSRFREIVRGRTTIMISHRFTNVSLADRIIVLDRGTVAETGTHEELIKKEGLYYSMYTRQSSRFGGRTSAG